MVVFFGGQSYKRARRDRLITEAQGTLEKEALADDPERSLILVICLRQ